MTDPATYTLLLAKQDFKFSCAHFTVFGAERAELLHGHNYRVEVELSGASLSAEGLMIDFPSVKGAIRVLCARLDSRTLIPSHSPHLSIAEADGGVEITFCDRAYRLPADEVILLPVINTTIEVLARMLWQDLARQLKLPHVEMLGVRVAETAGQSCCYRAPI